MGLPKIYKLVGMIWFGQTKEQEESQLDLATESSRLHEIILYNDEVNTFDHVINTLIEVCEHTPEQAEQCSLIVHYKGKCSVKRGSYDELEPKCIRLHAAGLSAEIV
jgi:ATP-dependent Clp protease adaptor protein ClpS